MLFEPSPPSNICPAPAAAPIHSETWWGASREFREWTLQGLGSTLPKLPENYPEETAPAFNMYLLPAGGCLSTLSKSSVDSVPLRETPAALDSHQTTGETSGRDGDPRPTSLHTPPPSAQLDSGVRWGLEGKPG